jgi:thiamine pyrophosphokinase
VDHRELLAFIRGRQSLALRHEKEPAAISLMALSERCSGVSISGVHWPLEKTVLDKDSPYAISNRPEEGKPTRVALDDGEMGVYVSWWER